MTTRGRSRTQGPIPVSGYRLGKILRGDAPVSGISDIDLLILRTQLRHALSSIGAHHQDAVVETVLLDRPYADVAARPGVTPGTLRTRVHYGLRQLRCVLETADAAAYARIVTRARPPAAAGVLPADGSSFMWARPWPG